MTVSVIRLCTHVPFALLQRLRAYCKARGITIDEGVTRCIVYGLEVIETKVEEDHES